MIELNAEYAAQQLLDAGHDEIRQTECYDNYGLPSYVR
jgi:hypothetical protein